LHPRFCKEKGKKMPRRILHGTIVSSKNDKTIVVNVERKFRHPLYGKFVKQSKKFKAHDAGNAGKVGEIVAIEECRPISKTKRWILKSKVGVSENRSVDVE
jgi:small subunit ribosomal protein S17